MHISNSTHVIRNQSSDNYRIGIRVGVRYTSTFKSIVESFGLQEEKKKHVSMKTSDKAHLGLLSEYLGYDIFGIIRRSHHWHELEFELYAQFQIS